MNKSVFQTHSQIAVQLILQQLNNYSSEYIDLSDHKKFNQYQTIQKVLTHQNHGFLTDLVPGQADDREFYDIVSPMIETAVSNSDLNTDNFDCYTDDPDYEAHEYFARLALRTYLRQTNQGISINELIYKLFDDGNVVVRHVGEGQEIYRPVLPQNLFVIDQSARTLEDTPVIERYVMTQTEVRNTKGWANTDYLYEYGNLGENNMTPYYEIFYWYGEISKSRLGHIKQEIHGIHYRYNKGDSKNYVQALIVMARVKIRVPGSNQQTNFFRNDQGILIPGIILFAEELKPEIIKINSKIEAKRYKPYESLRLGKYQGRFWGEGYREISAPYQNRINELGNQIRLTMEVAGKIVFWSSDNQIAGKNILSSIKNGQIIQTKDLNILNNTFPNLSLYAEEWNRNVDQCTKSLKAFEAASGETLPSNASATAVIVQNQAIGKYYGLKTQRIALLFSIIYKRWVLPDLLNNLDENSALKLFGDATFITEMIESYARGKVILNEMKATAMSGGMMYKEFFDALVESEKQKLLKQKNLFAIVSKDFFKKIELYVGINITGEAFNKQGRISNILSLLQYETNPNIINNPDAVEDLNEVRQMLGLKERKGMLQAQTGQAPQQVAQQNTAQNAPQATPANPGSQQGTNQPPAIELSSSPLPAGKSGG